MKILKNKIKIINEDIESNNQVNADDLSPAAQQKVQSLIDDAKNDSQIAKQVGGAVNVSDNAVTAKVAEAAEQVSKDAWEAKDLIPGSKEAVGLHNIEGALNSSLITAQRNKETNNDRDYPNIIMSGLAGFGKTAAVRAFCKEHHLNLFECDAKSLDISTLSGIPYPKKDQDGVLKQMPIVSSYWDRLSLPNTVLFLDELNRAPENVAGALLDLINNHNLPITTEHPNGKTTTVTHFDNILFTVIAINPASNIFSNVSEFTPEKVSRGVKLVNIKPSRLELLSCLKKIYDAIIQNPYLSEKNRAIYEGQYNIAEALLSNSNFTFDDVADVEEIHNKNNSDGYLTQFLNYRTLTGALNDCDGTKLDFLSNLYYNNFSATRTTMIKNILAHYTDKPLKGNSIFTKAQQTVAKTVTAAQQNKAARGVADALKDLTASLDNLKFD